MTEINPGDLCTIRMSHYTFTFDIIPNTNITAKYLNGPVEPFQVTSKQTLIFLKKDKVHNGYNLYFFSHKNILLVIDSGNTFLKDYLIKL